MSIILQNLAQLKKLYEKEWESIVGNCNEFLYLGGNEQSTHEYVSKLLGKETIDMNTYGQSKGHSGSYTTNWQLTGRELMTPDEVRMLDNRYSLLFIRGERPVKDLKFDILRHPNVALSADGSGEPYSHERSSYNVASVVVDPTLLNAEESEPENAGEDGDFAVFTEEEIEAMIANTKSEEIFNEKVISQKSRI